MDTLIPLIALLVALLVIGLLARTVASGRRELAQLRGQLQELSARLAEQSMELDGLCAAGVQLDRHLIDQGGRLRDCAERLASMQAQESANSPYHAAIEMIRKGAGAHEVAQQLGISLSEAELLVRLHRPV
jgi:uncharacterized coiled-coil protein SlyX